MREIVEESVRTFIESKIKFGELTGIQMKELEGVLVSMDMQKVNPEYADGFLKATGYNDMYAEYYRKYVDFKNKPKEVVVTVDPNELGVVKEGTVENKTSEDKIAEARAKGAKTAFDYVARELGVFSPDFTAEEQLKAIKDKIDELNSEGKASIVEFCSKLYRTLFQQSSPNSVAEIVDAINDTVTKYREIKYIITRD